MDWNPIDDYNPNVDPRDDLHRDTFDEYFDSKFEGCVLDRIVKECEEEDTDEDNRWAEFCGATFGVEDDEPPF